MSNPSAPIHLGKPCRNFNFQTMLSLVDPKDRREKLALSNYVGGGRGSIILIDVETHAGEQIPLPADDGAWAMAFVGDRYLVVGTDLKEGLVCRLDLTNREWAEPLHNAKTTYHWNVAQGLDGHLYFTTYPTAEVLRYNPIEHTLESIGRPTDVAGNYYSKEIMASNDGWIFVTGGFEQAFVSAWNIESREWTTVAVADMGLRYSIKDVADGCLYLELEGEPECYSIPSFDRLPDKAPPSAEEPIPSRQKSSTPGMYGFTTVLQGRRKGGDNTGMDISQARFIKRLRDHRIAGVAGQEYFIEDETGDRVYHRIPFDPPETVIHASLVLDSKGDLWGPCSFGQTIFRYSPADGSVWNSLAVCNQMGEVYGMVSLNGLLFMASYAGGDHVIYDPSQPWDQHNNVNPRTLDKVTDHICRAVGRSTIGPDGAVWSGWRAKYGTYGGALSRVDPVTFELSVWNDPVPGQTVMGVAADNEHIYFTTNPSGEGIPVKDNEPGWFGIWKPGTGLIAKHEMGLGEVTASLVVASERVFIVQWDRLAVFDIPTKSFRSQIGLGDPCTKLLLLADGVLAAFTKQKVTWIDVGTCTIIGSVHLEMGSFGAVATPDGRAFYFSAGMDLYLLEPKELWASRSR